MHTGSGLGHKAATQVCESEKFAFAYFALVIKSLVSLTSVHEIQKIAPKWPQEFLDAPNG